MSGWKLFCVSPVHGTLPKKLVMVVVLVLTSLEEGCETDVMEMFAEIKVYPLLEGWLTSIMARCLRYLVSSLWLPPLTMESSLM